LTTATNGKNDRVTHYNFDALLTFNDRDVLEGTGRVSKPQADAHAQRQYDHFATERRVWLEAEGEQANLQALEYAAKALQGRKKGG
jgi:hypothetical protein